MNGQAIARLRRKKQSWLRGQKHAETIEIIERNGNGGFGESQQKHSAGITASVKGMAPCPLKAEREKKKNRLLALS